VFTLGNASSPERQSGSGDDSQPALHDQGVPLSPSLSTDSAPPAAVVPHPKRIRVSSDVAARGLAHVVEPAYSPDVGITGTVVLHAIISREGEVTQLELVSGQPVLAQWAIDAARQWRYKPLKINGEPIQVDTTINVVFALDKHGHLKKQPRD